MLHNPRRSYAQVLPRMVGWQDMVLKLLTQNDNRESDLWNLATDILKDSLYQCLTKQSNGWHTLEETTAHLQYYVDAQLLDGTEVWNQVIVQCGKGWYGEGSRASLC